MTESLSKSVFIRTHKDYLSEAYGLCSELSKRALKVFLDFQVPYDIANYDMLIFFSGEKEIPPILSMSAARRIILITDQSTYGTIISNSELSKHIDYMLLRPLDNSLTAERIDKMLTGRGDPDRVLFNSYFLELEKRAGGYLKALGVPLRLDGYYYLRFTLAYCYLRPNAVWKTEVYPKLYKRYGKKPSCTERSMRYAIEYAWTHGNIDAQHRIFGYTIDIEKGKPVLRELIATLVDRMHIDDKLIVCGLQA